MTEYWWRSWHGAPMDHKWAVIAARAGVKVGVVSAVAWALIDYASQHEDRGCVVGFDAETYAVYSGFPENEVNAILEAMEAKGVIVNGRLANWEKRQPKSESEIQRATENRRKAKEKKERSEMLQNVTENYADTDKEEDTDTDTDTDTEIDKETESASSSFDALRKAFESKGIMPTGEAGVKALTELESAGVLPVDVIDGIDWIASHGKPARYASSVVGPAKTAMQKRLQQNGKPADNHAGKKRRILTGADGNQIEVWE